MTMNPLPPPDPQPEIECALPGCSATFRPIRANHRFCSSPHRLEYWHGASKTEPHNCPWCGLQHDPEEKAVLDALEMLTMTEAFDVRPETVGGNPGNGQTIEVVRASSLRSFLAHRRDVLNASAEVANTGHVF